MEQQALSEGQPQVLWAIQVPTKDPLSCILSGIETSDAHQRCSTNSLASNFFPDSIALIARV